MRSRCWKTQTNWAHTTLPLCLCYIWVWTDTVPLHMGGVQRYKYEAAIILWTRGWTSFYVVFVLNLFYEEKGDLRQEVQRAAPGCAVVFGAGRKCSEWAQHKGATSSGVTGAVCWHSAGMFTVKWVDDGTHMLLLPLWFQSIRSLILKTFVVM